MVIKFKGCPKCNGDLGIDEDEWFCWQCGFRQFINPRVPEKYSAREGTRKYGK